MTGSPAKHLGMSAVSSLPSPKYPICSDTEFNRLRSVIVGTAWGANHPNPDDPSFVNFFMPADDPDIRTQVKGAIPQDVLLETEEDIARLISVLEQFEIQVFRPEPFDSSVCIQTPYWKTEQLYSLMPRDCLLVIGKTVVEVASPTRARYFEVLPFRRILYDHRKQFRFRWLSCPRPALLDNCYGPNPLEDNADNKLLENEILFDAANCVRIGKDIFFDINRSANALAADWLQNDVLGPNYRVHKVYMGLDHADVTLVPIRPGLLLIDPKRVTKNNLPQQLKKWDIISLTGAPTLPFALPYPLASNGIGRNLLMIDPNTVIVGEEQHELIAELEKRKITVIPLRFRHARTFGGSFHCVTLDLHREGDGEAISYL